MKDLQNKTYDVMLAPSAAATTARTANVDLQGVHNVAILVSLGAELNTNSTNVAIQLSESDDTVATNFATFNADFNRTVDNTGAVVAVNHLVLASDTLSLRSLLTPRPTVLCCRVHTLCLTRKSAMRRHLLAMTLSSVN